MFNNRGICSHCSEVVTTYNCAPLVAMRHPHPTDRSRYPYPDCPGSSQRVKAALPPEEEKPHHYVPDCERY